MGQEVRLEVVGCGVEGVAPVDAGHVIDAFQGAGDKAMRIGTLVRGDGEAKVRYKNALKL